MTTFLVSVFNHCIVHVLIYKCLTRSGDAANAYSEPSHASEMEILAMIIIRWQLLNIFTKSDILDV